MSAQEQGSEQEVAAPEGVPSPPSAEDEAVAVAPDPDPDGDLPPAAAMEPDAPTAHADAPRAAGGGADADAEAVAEADAEPAGAGVAEHFDEAGLRERAGQAEVYLDLAQRTQADFDNYRKRMTREVRAAEARGIGRLARELLPALDNLERALAAAAAAEQPDHLSEGIRLVTAELSAALGRTGIQGYSPIGEVFDPSLHEAVAQQPFDGAEPGTVAQVLQSGYRLNEAILRPARVIVAS